MIRHRVLAALALAASLTACIDSDPTAIPTSTPRQLAAIPANWNGNIRIGVVTGATSITLGSTTDYTIKTKTSGATLLSGSGNVTVILTTPSVTVLRLQVVCGSPTVVAARIAAAQAAGYATFTEFVPAANCTRVLVGELPGNASTATRNAYKAAAVAAGAAANDAFFVARTISQTQYKLTRGATNVSTTEPPVITSATGRITINGAQYRGKGEVAVSSNGSLAGINELPIEEYLYGVVPKELGPIQYPELEAQKAQAVAARTYALSGLGKRAADGYDLLATTSDQVYGGYSAEHPVSNAAVDATHGVVLTYQGALISALYSSTSGGHTADNEEAFASSPVPYLRGIPDAERGQALEHVPNLDVFKAHANPKSLRNAKESDFESDWASFHRWSFEWSADEIHDVVSAFAGHDVGKVLAINVTDRGPSGRALRIEYVTEAGTFVDTKDHIRTSLKFITANNTMSSLPSTLFFIEPTIDHKTKAMDGFVAYGGGFGHGVGMAQTGAVGMAQKGHSYEEILGTYYQGTELTVKY